MAQKIEIETELSDSEILQSLQDVEKERRETERRLQAIVQIQKATQQFLGLKRSVARANADRDAIAKEVKKAQAELASLSEKKTKALAALDSETASRKEALDKEIAARRAQLKTELESAQADCEAKKVELSRSLERATQKLSILESRVEQESKAAEGKLADYQQKITAAEQTLLSLRHDIRELASKYGAVSGAV